MSVDSNKRLKIDWRVLFGFALTCTWVVTGLYYLLIVVGWQNFVGLPTADIGSFLEGAFAPLAFLWLVIGHFMQQTEISANTKAIYLQEKRAQMQEKRAQRMELHSQRDTYFKLLNLVEKQLGMICALHYFAICGPTGSREIDRDEFAELRSQVSSGDHTAFIRRMIVLLARCGGDQEKFEDVLYGTAVRKGHTDNYESTFDRLLEQARAADTDNLITDALLAGCIEGHYYRLIRYINGKEKDEPLINQLATGITSTQDQSQQRVIV